MKARDLLTMGAVGLAAYFILKNLKVTGGGEIVAPPGAGVMITPQGTAPFPIPVGYYATTVLMRPTPGGVMDPTVTRDKGGMLGPIDAYGNRSYYPYT